MTKNKKIFLCVFLVSCFFVLFIGTVSYADTVKIEPVSDLLNSRFPLENYKSYISSKTGFWGLIAGDTIINVVSFFADLFFDLAKLVYQLFDFAVEQLYTMNLLGKLNGIVGNLTNNLWGTLKDNYASLIIVIAILMIAKTIAFDGIKEGVYQLAKIVLVLVVAGVWFPRASDYLSQMNDYSFILQAEVLSVAGSVDETSGLSAVTNEGKPDTQTANQQATNIIRNELFRQTIYNPFLLFNYGTTDKNEINNLYKDVKDEDIPKISNGEYLLSKEFSELEDKEKSEKLDVLAEENPYLTGDKVGYKFIMGIISVIGVFLYGIPVATIACINMFLQLLAILYSYILPLIAIISLLPRYSNGLVNSIVNIVKIFMGKGILGLLVLMFTLINLTIDLLVPPRGIVSAIFNTMLKGLIYILLWKYKDKILRVLVSALTNRSNVNTNVRMKQLNKGMEDFFNGVPAIQGGVGIPQPAHDYTPILNIKDAQIANADIQDVDVGNASAEDNYENPDSLSENDVQDVRIVDSIDVENADDLSVDKPEDTDVDTTDTIDAEDIDTVSVENPDSSDTIDTEDTDTVSVENPDDSAVMCVADEQTNNTTETASGQHEIVKENDVAQMIQNQINLHQNNNNTVNQQQNNDYSQQANVTVNNRSYRRESSEQKQDFMKRLIAYRH